MIPWLPRVEGTRWLTQSPTRNKLSLSGLHGNRLGGRGGEGETADRHDQLFHCWETSNMWPSLLKPTDLEEHTIPTSGSTFLFHFKEAINILLVGKFIQGNCICKIVYIDKLGFYKSEILWLLNRFLFFLCQIKEVTE